MSQPPTDNDERPYEDMEELLLDYGYSETEKAKAYEDLVFVKSLMDIFNELERDFSIQNTTGRVYSIQAPWGMGKTSYMNILMNLVRDSDKIDNQFLCYYYYDSLYYGDVSEAITTLLQQLFRRVEKQYVIKLRGITDIAMNLTPSFEVGGIFGKLNFMKKNEDTNTIISKNIRSKLTAIGGKIFLVIDDIDRLTSSEALHLLRMVRLLQDLPNTFVFLPIDYDALIKMLDKENVANPGGYVRKIITKSIRFNIRNDCHVLFKKNCIKHLNLIDNDNTQKHLNDLWMGYLLELSMQCLMRLETSERAVRIEMGIKPDDVVWERAEVLDSENGKNFIQSFFEQTRRQYFSVQNDYYVCFKYGEDDPEKYRLYRYYDIVPHTTVDRFFKGTYNKQYLIQQLGGGLEMITGRSITDMVLYKEDDVASALGVVKKVLAGENEYYDATKDQIDQLQGKGITLWDLLIETVSVDDFPKEIFKHVSPRMIKRLIDDLKRNDLDNITKVINEPRSIENNLYNITKDSISDFVNAYAME